MIPSHEYAEPGSRSPVAERKGAMRTRSLAITAITIGFIFLFAQEAAAQITEIRVLASNAVKAVIEDIRPRCERTIGHPLAVQFNTTAALKEKIEAGEAFDVAIFTSEVIDDLIKEGKIAAGTRAEISRVGIGIGIRAGAPRPDISTPDALKQTLLKAKSITYTRNGASGVYNARMFDRLGIAGDLRPKIILQEESTRSAASVAEGQNELLITLISEILPVHGIELLGPLPAELQSYVGFAAGVSAKARNAEAGKALIEFFTSPALAPTFKATGMEPR